MSTRSNRSTPSQPAKNIHPVNGGQASAPIKLSEMEMIIERLDGNASRFYNGLNQLERIADRLSTVPEEKKTSEAPNSYEGHIPKLHAMNNYVDSQNNRLENLLARLHSII